MVKPILSNFKFLVHNIFCFVQFQTPNVGGQGCQNNMLTDEQCTLVHRFDPRSIATETLTVDRDTIGFFIAKFVKLNYCNTAT